MPFRSHLTDASKQDMAPVRPEDKCSSRKRRRPTVPPTTTATPLHPLEEQDLLDAALFDCGSSDLDSDDAPESRDHLKRLCVATSETMNDDDDELQLCEEVQTLKASVHAMAANVAKAALKINELRDLVSLLVEQQQQEQDAN